MYGPNYVKLSRRFAVQLFSMFIGHCTALPPVRFDPHWPHSHAITASIRPALTHALQHTLYTARDSNLGSGNHDMSRLSALAYPNDALIHGLTDIPLRLLSADIGCGTPGAPRSRRDTATHTARDSDLGSDNRDMSGLSALAYPSDAPIHRLTDIPLRLLSADIGVWHPRPSLPDHARQHTLLATQASAVATAACLDYLHSHTRTQRLRERGEASHW
jgi:hypothetical protein